MSQYQLLPYKRVQAFFTDQMGIPISEGSVYNFSLSAYSKLERFESITKQQLVEAPLLHVDETGININGDSRHWLPCATNASWTYFFPHKKRGNEATDPEGILPAFKGVLCHDHWKPYYRYTDCLQALCNAYHLRELIGARDQDKQKWADKRHAFLVEVNKDVHKAAGKLNDECAAKRWKEYAEILENAEIECPPPDENDRPPGKRGRLKRSKSRHLLERFINYEEDVMRFMDNEAVPFTNNQGEASLPLLNIPRSAHPNAIYRLTAFNIPTPSSLSNV
jgi:transposase